MHLISDSIFIIVLEFQKDECHASLRIARSEHGEVSAKITNNNTRSFMKDITSLLVLLPLTNKVFFIPSIIFGSFLRRRRIARIDFGFSYIAYKYISTTGI